MLGVFSGAEQWRTHGGNGGPEPPLFQIDGPRDFPKKSNNGGTLRGVRQIQYILMSKKGIASFSESLEGVVSKKFLQRVPPQAPPFFGAAYAPGAEVNW